MKRKTILKSSIITMFLVAASAHAVAQADTGELAASGGLASYHYEGQSSNKGKFGASASLNLLSYLSIGFEYSYSPVVSASVSEGGETVSASANLQTYGGVAHFGLLHEPRIQPYVLFAAGGSRDSASASESGDGETSSASGSESGGYFGFGGGLNARLGGHFGVRPEVRYQRLSIDGTKLNEIDVTGSVYYTFGEHTRKKCRGSAKGAPVSCSA